MRRRLFAGLVLVAAVAGSSRAHAWPPDGLALCAAAGEQTNPAIVTDGAGGAIVAWKDRRNGASTGWDVYAQRVDALGVPQWALDGVPLTTAPGDQTAPRIASDGAGGAIVVWQDDRDSASTDWDIYARRIGGDGSLQWSADGTALSTAAGAQVRPHVVSDAAGGAIVVWDDLASSGALFAVRVDAAGVSQWTTAVTSVASSQLDKTVIADGAGGVIAAWEDGRNSTIDVYAQRLTSNGTRQWAAPGVSINGSANSQIAPSLAYRGTGLVFVAWQDDRSGPGLYDIYAARVTPEGTVIDASGVPLCTHMSPQFAPAAVSDGSDGAIVAWRDPRPAAQRVSAAGAVQWVTNGLAFGNTFAVEPRLISDGAGGAIAAWSSMGPSFDIYAQRISSSGSSQWGASGLKLCGAAGAQQHPMLVADGASGAIVAWDDGRGGAGQTDIYVQRARSDGTVDVGTAGPRAFRVMPARPNPTRSSTAFGLVAAVAERVTAGVFDVRGRLVRVLADGESLGPGTHALVWDGRDDAGLDVSTGLYLVRVRAGHQGWTAKVCVLR